MTLMGCRSTARRIVSGLLALLFSFAASIPAAYARPYTEPPALADEPIAARPRAEPSVVTTVDDSTSMLSEFLPDWVIKAPPGGSGSAGFCRDATGLMNALCGYGGDSRSPEYIYTASNTPYPTYAAGSPPNAFTYSASSIPDWHRAWPAPVHSAALNRIYYDPAIDYAPPLDSTGTPYPQQTTYTSVTADPWASVMRNINLTSSVNVGLYCNTDWPLTTNWNPSAGGGDWCRVNGTNYASRSPPTTGDYQYPWRKTSGIDDTKYFWRNGGNMTLWCDKSSPRWPRSCTASGSTYTCPPGETYVPPATLPQACVQTGTTTGCLGFTTTYDPPGCNTDPRYGAPGPCAGPECLHCASSTTCTGGTGIIGKTGVCRLSSTLSGGSGAACNCSGASCTLPACPDFNPGGIGSCSGGSPATLDPGTTTCSPKSGDCSDKLWDSATNAEAVPNVTLLQDSNTLGEVCRHNNQAYSDGTSALPFNYGSAHAKYKSAITSGCVGIPASASIPRHYWKTSVEWCEQKIVAPNDKWNGFGKAGACQDDHDSAHPYPRYYQYGVPKSDPAYADNYTYPAFERVDLRTTGANYTHTFRRGSTAVTITRTPAQEFTNYANWFAYYRTRIQLAKTVISQNFKYLNDKYQVGFHTLSNKPTSSFVNPNYFTASQKQLWYEQLFAITVPMGNITPSLDAVVRIGELYKNSGNAALAGSTDPIKLSCQKNYHLLFTDGITNQPGLPSVLVGNVDNTVLSLPQPLVVAPPIEKDRPWPAPYREDPNASTADSLSDYAMHYWVTDLRPGMQNNVPTGEDVAPWQHLNFAALSLGTEGLLPSASPAATEAKIEAGVACGLFNPCKWPSPVPKVWQPVAGGVDDLWHAAVNGRGRFVNARTSRELGLGIAAILEDITSAQGGRVGVVFANPNLSSTNNFTYRAGFVEKWGGTLQKLELQTSGDVRPSRMLWEASAALFRQTTPTVLLPTPWYTERRIVTLDEANPPKAVPFLHNKLGSATQLPSLGPDATAQVEVVEYLRGRRDLEGDSDGQFRTRASPLGDIVNSQPVFVANPQWQYEDANDPGYSAFKDAHKNRPTRIYVGANDAMLHAFDDSDGSEAWAFIPRDFYRKDDWAGLIGLTWQPGALPAYQHRYFVDATPRVVDADFGSGDWRTLLVAGLGKGGRSYFAFDVTEPAGFSDEDKVASKFLWEFRNADMGYTFGRPAIVKTRAHGWVVVVSNGYNSPSGQSKLYFLKASDGTLLKTMCAGNDGGDGCSAPFGSASAPAGMAHFAGYVRDSRNQTVEQIYGGDLYGNLWRFDVYDQNPANWKVEKLAELRDANGNRQPVTTPPQIELDIQSGAERWVIVGTGRLLGEPDTELGVTALQQSLYALRDGTQTAPAPITAPLTRAELDLVSGAVGLGSGVVAENGWYDDLPTGERIIAPPQASIGLVAYVSSKLSTDKCEVGLPGDVYVRSFANGETALPGGAEKEELGEGGVGLDLVAIKPPNCEPNCVPEIKLIVTTSRRQVTTLPVMLPRIFGQSRINWRVLSP